MVFYVFIAVLVAFMCAAIFFLRRYEHERRRKLAQEAERLGLRYSYYDPFGIATTYAHLSHLNLGLQQYAFNVVHGAYQGHTVSAFDFSYSVEPKKRRRNQPMESYILSLAILMMDTARLPQVVVRYRPLAEKFPPLPEELKDVPFEGPAFSHMYEVRSADSGFARAVLHQGMQDYLVKHPGTTLEFNGNTLLAHMGEVLGADVLESELQRMLEIRRLIPARLLQGGE